MTSVASTNPALASIEPSRQRARSKAGWHSRELEQRPITPQSVPVTSL
ncbi:hypothetical protein [Methylobacterium sp. ID0610]